MLNLTFLLLDHLMRNKFKVKLLMFTNNMVGIGQKTTTTRKLLNDICQMAIRKSSSKATFIFRIAQCKDDLYLRREITS